MKVLFDTNIFVAAMIESHPNHPISLPWIQKVRSKEIIGYISTHSIAELYAVITWLPLLNSINPRQAQEIIINNLETFNTINLGSNDYLEVLENVSQLNIVGGGIYDAIIAQAALKVNVDILLTLNPKHFTRLGENITRIIRDPSSE